MNYPSLIPVVLMAVIMNACGVYSFSGASISPEVKTVTVLYFNNRASLVQPQLSQLFTERLKEKFVSQANLRSITDGGDLQFEGFISDYRTSPVAIQGNETAALNRLSITVSVKFTNRTDSRNDFESSFTRYSDYDSQKSLTEVESTLIDEITRQLIDDIFNRSVSNW